MPTAHAPAILRFSATLFRDQKKRLLLHLPAKASAALHASGMPQVEGTINGHAFRATPAPDAEGGHTLLVNPAMSKGAKADAGDTVKMVLLEPQPEPAAPADLAAALRASARARRLWDDLGPAGRRDWIRWVEMAAKAETRDRRLERTIDQLAEGKRRPCCVNAYEYLTQYIPTNFSREQKR